MIPDNLYYCELAKCNCAVVKPPAHWKFRNDNSLMPTGYYECSLCEIGKELTKTNFCPYCGADMRGEEEKPQGDGLTPWEQVCRIAQSCGYNGAKVGGTTNEDNN